VGGGGSKLISASVIENCCVDKQHIMKLMNELARLNKTVGEDEARSINYCITQLAKLM
jgi:hypothetical protein